MTSTSNKQVIVRYTISVTVQQLSFSQRYILSPWQQVQCTNYPHLDSTSKSLSSFHFWYPWKNNIIKKKILHNLHTEIWNFSFSVEKYFRSEQTKQVRYSSKWEDKFCIFKRSFNVLLNKHQWNTKPFYINSFWLQWKVRFIM